MPNDNEEILKQLEQRVQEVGRERIRVETQLEQLRQQRDGLLTQLKELGIDPAKLAEEIAAQERQLDEELAAIAAQIPEGY